MRRRLLFTKFILTMFISLLGNSVFAQLPVCSGPGSGLVYYTTGAQIMNWDPTLPFSTTNPWPNTISPMGSGSLAVAENINGPGPSPTFYVIIGSTYHYWDGTTWINTGHDATAVNPGGSGNFIYSLVGSDGQIWKYDGTGNATLLITITDFNSGGPYDMVGDCEGNFYLLNFTSSWLRKYSPTGTLLQTWTTTGNSTAGSGGGMAIINNKVYCDNFDGLWEGTIVGTTVNFVNLGPSLGPSDFGSCALGGLGNQTGVNDTVYYCAGAPGIDLVSTSQETDTITWTVASGDAVLTGGGDTVNATATTTSVIYSSSTTICGTVVDTFLFVVPTATLTAGVDDTTYGCGTYRDTLNGAISNTTAGVNYTYTWTPAGTIIGNGNTLQPIIAPTGNTSYILTLTSTQGGCTWADTVNIFTVDESVVAAYTSVIKYGCGSDTVELTNLSQNTNSYFWDFGDGTTDTSANPIHVFDTQAVYNIKLVVNNGTCWDSVITSHDLQHPLAAAFTVDNDTICQGQVVTFTDASTTTVINGINPEYTWNFGDSTFSTQQSPAHQYDHPGVFEVMMIVKDFVPCMDTTYHTIVVDSQSSVKITASDSLICTGQSVSFEGIFLTEGLNSYYWTTGDGFTFSNVNPIEHTYEYPGIYEIILSADYAVCNDSIDTVYVVARPHPLVNLGTDTTMCPNAEPLVLTDHINSGNGSASWEWNTGETTPAIVAKAPGNYYTVVTIDGCSGTDSITVLKDCYIDIPNSFTPNADNQNDYFMPRQFLSRSVKTFKMSIFNRWGQVVYETTKPDGRGWDGKFNDVLQPQGVFIYLVEVSFADGRNEKYQGNVTLLR